MSLQALYTQNSWIYPSITQYLQNNSIIIPTYSITLTTLDNTMDFYSICHKHSDTVLKLWHLYSFNALFSFPACLALQLLYPITAKHLWSTIILKQNCCITQKHLVDVPINHLMKWHDWCKYPFNYDNYSDSNYRLCLLRLLQCQDLKLLWTQVYTSAWQLQLNNLQLNSTSWSTHRSIKPHGFHPYIAMSKTCCYFRTTDSICLLWLLQSQGLTALLRLQWIFYL